MALCYNFELRDDFCNVFLVGHQPLAQMTDTISPFETIIWVWWEIALLKAAYKAVKTIVLVHVGARTDYLFIVQTMIWKSMAAKMSFEDATIHKQG
jgi:hypothetical protein